MRVARGKRLDNKYWKIQSIPAEMIMYEPQVRLVLSIIRTAKTWPQQYSMRRLLRCSSVLVSSCADLRAIGNNCDPGPYLLMFFCSTSPGGGTGRRYGLKIRFPKGSAGSIPAPGTNLAHDAIYISHAEREITFRTFGRHLEDAISAILNEGSPKRPDCAA